MTSKTLSKLTLTKLTTHFLAAAVFLLSATSYATTIIEPTECSGSTIDPLSVCSASNFVTSTDLSIFAFTIETANKYILTLTDTDFPSPLATLSLVLSTSTEAIDTLDTAGTLMFFAAPGTYFAQIYSEAALMSSGVYSLQVRVVPLPATAVLFLSGLALFFTLRRRRPGSDPSRPGPQAFSRIFGRKSSTPTGTASGAGCISSTRKHHGNDKETFLSRIFSSLVVPIGRGYSY